MPHRDATLRVLILTDSPLALAVVQGNQLLNSRIGLLQGDNRMHPDAYCGTVRRPDQNINHLHITSAS